MALQSSGVITMADIAAEFGGSAPHNLSEYYGAAAGIPSSGAIDMADFYGASNIIETSHTLTIATWSKNFRGYRQAQGNGGFSPTSHNGLTIYELWQVDGGTDVLNLRITGNHASNVFKEIQIDGKVYSSTSGLASQGYSSPYTYWTWNMTGGAWPGSGTKTVYIRT